MSNPYALIRCPQRARKDKRDWRAKRVYEDLQRAFVDHEPIVTRVCNDYSSTTSDYTVNASTRTQTFFTPWKINCGYHASLATGQYWDSLLNQFCAYYNQSNLSGFTEPKSLHFIDVNCETSFTNTANTTALLDIWVVHPRGDVPIAQVGAGGTTTAMGIFQSYENAINQALAADNTQPLSGPGGAADVVPTSTTVGVLPYDARAFCQMYKLVKLKSVQLKPAQTFILKHGKTWNRTISITEFANIVDTGEGLFLNEMAGVTYGLLGRVRGLQHVITDNSTEAGFSACKLAYHTTARWRFCQGLMTSLAHPIVSMPNLTFTAISTPMAQGPGISSEVAYNSGS